MLLHTISVVLWNVNYQVPYSNQTLQVTYLHLVFWWGCNFLKVDECQLVNDVYHHMQISNETVLSFS